MVFGFCFPRFIFTDKSPIFDPCMKYRNFKQARFTMNDVEKYYFKLQIRVYAMKLQLICNIVVAGLYNRLQDNFVSQTCPLAKHDNNRNADVDGKEAFTFWSWSEFIADNGSSIFSLSLA